MNAEDPSHSSTSKQSHLLQRHMPRGRHALQRLGELLTVETVEKADRPFQETDRPSLFLYVPEYAGSRVTADLDAQTVKPRAVYRLAVDPRKANPRFLAQLLNSPFGKHLRATLATGATIQRVSAGGLLALELPVPDLATQNRIARIDSDIGLLGVVFQEMQTTLNQNWSALPEIAEKIDALKAVLDIERRISDWWRELPYPLATIYRRYSVLDRPKDRLDALLHFFEMAAIYLAAVGTSHVKALREDWKRVLAAWLHPAGTAGIERTDFGFWIGLARSSLKDINRIASDAELRINAIDFAGSELVEHAPQIGRLGKATDVLDIVRRYRNSWKGHGGHIKPSDAAQLDRELQQPIRDLYEITASTFRRLQLVRPGMADVTGSAFKYQIEMLSGSDPTFDRRQVELECPVQSNVLAFWVKDARRMCSALPFFRLGAPQQPQETSFYVFNRVENGGFRWISYQETREQEFVAPDDELLKIVALGKRSPRR